MGLETYVHDINLDVNFVKAHKLTSLDSVEKIFQTCDIISLHMPLLESTKGLISRSLLQEYSKPGMVLINTSRAGLVEQQDILTAIRSGQLGGYLTDVLDAEPMDSNCILRNQPGILITPHIGSRTKESIQKQGSMAVNNLLRLINK